MTVTYKPIDGEHVSKEWLSVLSDMRADGVRFNVNEGHRTMARQWYFWRLYRSGAGAIAAFPSPFAPHIRTGRIDHAIDFSNDPAVFAWLQAHGLNPTRPVRWPNGSVRESWHIEVSASALRSYYAKWSHRHDVIQKGSHGAQVKKLQVLLRQTGYLRRSWKAHEKYTITVRRAVRKFQREHNLPVDGIVGQKTWGSLKRAKKVQP